MTDIDHKLEARILEGLWGAIAEHGWRGATMARIAAAGGVTLAELRSHASCPQSLVMLSLRVADRAVLAGTVPTEGESPRDRIFDVLMRRLDQLQPHRAGVVRFMKDLPFDPLFAIGLGIATERSMAWMLDAAGIGSRGVAGELRKRGMMGIWVYTLNAWMKDESGDMAATMAALDKALDRADQIARSLDPEGRQSAAKPEETQETP
ncbi:MAG: TetR family transcriptional regulator [Alphaproteobacteria bacterium]|nr:TetR family transcriptional regulator [Alphaproteobacteria bacterium]